jgi:hypothetical protein
MDQLGAAAALLGKKGGTSEDVDLYQSLLTSRKVIHNLLWASLSNRSDSGKGEVQPLFKILGIDTSKPVKVEEAVKQLSKAITVNSKANGGDANIIEVKVSAEAPWLAQEICDILLTIGQEQLRLVRIERSDIILSRLELAVAQAKSEWDSSARALTWYRDRNRSILLPEQMLMLSRLELEKTTMEQNYLLARREYELRQLDRAKAAPPMVIFDPANLPAQMTSPKKGIILAVGFTLGFFGSIIGILCWKAFCVVISTRTNENTHGRQYQ